MILKKDHNEDEPQDLEDRFQYGKAYGHAVLVKNDSILKTLQQGFIADFFETGDRASGEIAVVARAQELKGDTQINYSKNAADSGRVVYYSDNVIKGGGKHKGQYLNFSAMPLYGPIKYNGGPIFIEIYIIEMDDAESQQYRELLKQLASLGAIAYPPASPVLGVLDSIGSALLSGAQNDVEFRYHLTLWPYIENKAAFEFRQAYLHEGNLIFVKQDHHRHTRRGTEQSSATEPVKWEDLGFNSQKGRLVYKQNVPPPQDGEKSEYIKGSDYKKHTYLTLRISKRQDSTDADLANDYFSLGDLIQSMVRDDVNKNIVSDAITKLKDAIDGRSP